MIASMLLLLSSDGTVQAAATAMVEPDPRTMTQKEIREYNKQFTRSDPMFIRCVRQDEIGSLVKKTYSCRTNRQWAVAFETGNNDARDTADAMKGKAINTN